MEAANEAATAVGVGLLGVVGHGAEGGQVGGEAVAGAGVGRSGGYELKKKQNSSSNGYKSNNENISTKLKKS